MADWGSDSDDGDKFDWGSDVESEPLSASALSYPNVPSLSTLDFSSDSDDGEMLDLGTDDEADYTPRKVEDDYDDDLDSGSWDDDDDGETEADADGSIFEMMAANRINPYSSARGVAIVELDMNWFHCPVCSRLLSPPVFQCKRGHLACDGCRAGKCRRCKEGSGSFDARNAVVEDIISVSKFKCPNSGCNGFFPYPELLTHSGACHHAPCFCTEPGCTFAASPTGLLSHLATNHSWPAHSLTYGKVLWIRAPLSERRRLLLAEDDARVFALVVGALGAATAVSVVCVRDPAPGASQPRYTAALHARRPPPMGCTAMASMETVTSSNRPGEVTVEKLPCVLLVPSTMEQSADGASKEVTLKICVKKVGGD